MSLVRSGCGDGQCRLHQLLPFPLTHRRASDSLNPDSLRIPPDVAAQAAWLVPGPSLWSTHDVNGGWAPDASAEPKLPPGEPVETHQFRHQFHRASGRGSQGSAPDGSASPPRRWRPGSRVCLRRRPGTCPLAGSGSGCLGGLERSPVRLHEPGSEGAVPAGDADVTSGADQGAVDSRLAHPRVGGAHQRGRGRHERGGHRCAVPGFPARPRTR